MNSPAKKSLNLNESDVISIGSDSQCENNSPLVVNKTRKTYEKKKHSENHTSFTASSPKSENITTPSPNNTSRYGRARRPKITEDFYNTEDIFGPYERIPCSPLRSSPKKKPQIKLELPPNKSQEVVTISVDESADLTSVLSINIPEDSIEVSKVLKIVTNNSSSDFSPKSPTLFSKPVKTYANRHKKNSDSVYESFGLPDYPAPYLSSTVPMSEDPFLITEHTLALKEGGNNTLLQDPVSLGDETIFPQEIPKPSVTSFITKHNMSIEVETSSASKIVSEKLSDDSFSKPKNNTAVVKTNKENNEKQFNKVKQPRKQKLESSSYLTSSEKDKKKLDKHGKRRFKKKFVYNVVGKKKNRKKKVIPVNNDTDISVMNNTEKPAHINTLGIDAIFHPNVGSICWSRVGGFPFWPSIVSNEPDTDCFCKKKTRGRHTIEFYHVHFFGDNGRRSWVNYTHLFPFHGKTDLEQMAKCVLKEAKPKDPRHISAFIIPSAKLTTWETAVSEAENIIRYSQEKRMEQFFELVVLKRKQKRSFDFIRSPDSDKPKQKKLKLDEGVNHKKLKKKLEKLVAATNPSVKGKTSISDTAEIERLFGSRRKSLRIYEISKSTPASDDSGSESDAPGKKSSVRSVKNDIRDTPSPTLSLSSLPKKKINLFKGVTRERVCQLCGKGRNVFKCKGTCFGYYHIECDKQQQSKLKIKVEEVEDKIGDKPETAEIIVGEVLEEILTSAAKAIQKTNSLSLAEKIDLKMQEVMHNILSEAIIYADNTDSCSESDDYCEVVSQLPIDQANHKKPKPNKRLIKHVTADGVLVIEDDETDEDRTEEDLMVSKEDLENYKCTFCATNTSPPCFICNEESTASGDGIKHKCMTPQCGRYYHAECLKEWPQTKWYASMKNQNIDHEELSCPYHNCHTCISDDPRAPLARQNNEKLSKCIRCPTTYHINSYCIPAGSQILTAYQIICPKHLGEDESTSKQYKMKLMHHVNTSWCFICSMGGSLICCETCPSSFHVECLKLTPPEGRYICEECESGRLPLYDDVVWVKLGAYRWWPAQILFPSMIPERVNAMTHHKGEFVVRFFGSHDHYWVNRGRVFLFQEGDTGHSSSKKNAVDWLFIKAIKEATVAHKQFMDARQDRVADYHTSMKPPSYVKIKVNKPVGAIKSIDADTSNTTPCDCNPKMQNPCGPDSDCLNRILLTECQPMVCAAGQKCCNQSFQNRRYTPVKPFKTAGKGWGLKTLVPLKKGTFVIEYVGEVINESEYKRRMKRKHEQKDENYYFLTIEKDRMIDAGPKGNVARFMNHSCFPNCETQKWTVNGDTKVGLFAIKDIPQGTELTFNYNLQCIGEEKKECRCGAPNCSGFIGVKAKQDKYKKKRKFYAKTKKKKPVPENIAKNVNCFKCGEPDAVQKCNRVACNKVYHTDCINFKPNQNGKWFCPWHSCNICAKRTIRSCFMCMNSFCPVHSTKNIRYDQSKGFICSVHDSRYYRNRNGRRSKIEEEDPSSESTSNKPDSTDDTKTKEKNTISKSKHDLEQCVNEEVDEVREEEGNNKRRTSGRLSRADNLILRSSRPSSPVLESSPKRPNGAYIVEKVRNQNNNLDDKKTINKRKSRMSLKKSDDEDLDDIPLEKRLKMSSSGNTSFLDLDDSPLLDRMKKNLDTEMESKEVPLEDVSTPNRLQMQSTNVEITDDHEQEITSYLCDDDTPILQRLKTINSEVSIRDDNTPILHRLRRLSKNDSDTTEDLEICNAFNSTKPSNTDYDNRRPRSEFRRFTRSLSRTDFDVSSITIEDDSKNNSKVGRSRRDRKTPTKMDRKKRSLSFSSFKFAEEAKKADEAKDIEKTKELKKITKRPVGRPRKYFKTPMKLQESERVNKTLSVEATEPSVDVEEVKPTEETIETPFDKPEFEVPFEKVNIKDVKENNSSTTEELVDDKMEEAKVKTTAEESETDINLESPDDLSKENNVSPSAKDDLFPEYSHLVTISDNTDNSSEDKFISSPFEEAVVSIVENSDNLQEVDKIKEHSEEDSTDKLKTPKKRFTRQNLSLTRTNEDLSHIFNVLKKSEDITKNSVITTTESAITTTESAITTTESAITTTESVPTANENQIVEEESLNKSPIKSPKKRYTRYNLSLLRNEEESSSSLDGVTEVKQIEEKCFKKRFTRYNFNISNHVDSSNSNSNSLNVTEEVNDVLKDFSVFEKEEKPANEAIEIEPSEGSLKVINQDKNENVEDVTEPQIEIKKFNLSLRKSASSKDIAASRLTVKQQKLLNPRPGIRKSSRYSLPDSTTEIVVNHILETDSDKEVKTVKNDSSKPSPFKKKVLQSGVRKSARFSKSNLVGTIINSTKTPIIENSKNEKAIDSSSQLRKHGRFIKKPIINFTKLVTTQETPPEVYKIKPSNDSRFDNHVNDVKLTTNVPERHLRVILRKTEFESRSDSKFIKMQNDIEKDLPIRKRSKLRYENQLPD